MRFVGSVGGWLWGVIHPLVQLACWTFIFQMCLKIPMPASEVGQNFTIWLSCGYLPWLLFQETLQRSSTCLLDHSNLITKTVFPSEVLPIAVFLSALVSHLMALTMLIAVCLLWLGQISGMIVLLPFYMLLTGLFAVGLGWITSSLQVYLRDTSQVVSVILTLWMWTTPIWITEDQVPEQLRALIHYNPMSYLVRAYRLHMQSYRLPDITDVLILTTYAVAAFLAGGLVFRHLKRGFADVL